MTEEGEARATRRERSGGGGSRGVCPAIPSDVSACAFRALRLSGALCALRFSCFAPFVLAVSVLCAQSAVRRSGLRGQALYGMLTIQDSRRWGGIPGAASGNTRRRLHP